jgi:hypothetical protein
VEGRREKKVVETPKENIHLELAKKGGGGQRRKKEEKKRKE